MNLGTWWEGEEKVTGDEVLAIADMLHDLELPIERAAAGLTGWEQEFLDSVERQFADRGSLSPKQMTILRRIHQKWERT